MKIEFIARVYKPLNNIGALLKSHDEASKNYRGKRKAGRGGNRTTIRFQQIIDNFQDDDLVKVTFEVLSQSNKNDKEVKKDD